MKPLLVAADLLTVVVAMQLAYRLKANLPGNPLRNSFRGHLLVAGLSLPLWGAFLARQKLYVARYLAHPGEELRRLARGTASSTLALALIAFMTKVYVARGWLVLTFCFAVGLLALERAAVRWVFAVERRQGRLLRPVVIVGGNHEGHELVATLRANPALGYSVVGWVDDVLVGEAATTIGRTLDVVRTTGASGVVVATTAVTLGTSNALARELTDAGLHVELSSSLRDIAVERLRVQRLGRYPVIYVEPVSRSGWRPAAKRAFDLAGASVALLLASPLLVAAAAAIRATSPGPVLFRQRRIGKDGTPFFVLKLRTMVQGAEGLRGPLLAANERDGPMFKMRRDPRVTPVGRLLRRVSLDELPQLWNVLRGEMSLVGPRPALPGEVDGWPVRLHQRLRVKPGMTGMWQVHARSEASFEAYERLDLYYVDNWSLVQDMAILARTLPAVVAGRGAC